MTRFLTIIGIGIIIFTCSSCSTDEDPSDVDSIMIPDTSEEAPNIIEMLGVALLSDDVVLEDMHAMEIEEFEDKTPVQIVTVLEGTQRVTINAHFRGIRNFGFGFPLYECELMSEDVEKMGGIASGMSGSPVGPPGKVMGALAYGDYFASAPTRFWVTPIDAMESLREHQTFGDELEERLAAAPSGKINSVYAPVKTPLMITGINPSRLEHLSTYLKGSRFDHFDIFAGIGGVPAAPVVDRKLMAGDMIGVAIATGDVVNAIGFGTLTQIYDDDTFVAFGHPFSSFGDGKTSLPVYRAVVNGLVPNLQSSYKSVSAYGDPIGTITKDLVPAIVGQIGVIPETIPFNITYQRAEKVIKKEHEVSYGYELYIPIIAAVTQDAIRLETSPTTVEVTIKLEFKESQNSYSETFISVSDDSYFDILFRTQRIISTFTDIFNNTTEKATLTSVEMTIEEKPEIMLATIQEVIMSDEIVRGTSTTVTVVLLPHWSAIQDEERKIEKQVTLEIPQDHPLGDAWITVYAEDYYDPFFSIFFDDDSDSDSDMLPENLDELIEQLEENQNESPSIITIVLSDEIISTYDIISSDEPQNTITVNGFIVTGRKSESVKITQ